MFLYTSPISFHFFTLKLFCTLSSLSMSELNGNLSIMSQHHLGHKPTQNVAARDRSDEDGETWLCFACGCGLPAVMEVPTQSVRLTHKARRSSHCPPIETVSKVLLVSVEEPGSFFFSNYRETVMLSCRSPMCNDVTLSARKARLALCVFVSHRLTMTPLQNTSFTHVHILIHFDILSRHLCDIAPALVHKCPCPSVCLHHPPASDLTIIPNETFWHFKTASYYFKSRCS